LQLRVTRIDPSLPLPAYQSAGAVGFDLACRLETQIAPHALGLVPANVVVQVPPGHVLLVTLRSSTPRKNGLLMPHGVGIIDQDYSGPNDEIMIQVYNYTAAPVTVDRGERIAQGILTPVSRPAVIEAPIEVEHSRGGFGSTG